MPSHDPSKSAACIDGDLADRRQRSLTRLQEMVREAEADVAAGRVGFFDADATLRAVRQRSFERDLQTD